MELEKTIEQPEMDSTVDDNQPDKDNEVTETEVDTSIEDTEIDLWESGKLSLTELKKKLKDLEAWNLRQEDYTKKTTEVANERKKLEAYKDLIDSLEEKWILSAEDLNKLQVEEAKTPVDASLDNIVSLNPDLENFKSAIKQLSTSDNLTPEEVVEKYGFKSKDKLVKAKSQGEVKWYPKKEKSISEMSMEEYEQYRHKMWIWTRPTFQ